MNLILLPNKTLRKKSKEVTFPLSAEDCKLADAMIKHVDDSKLPGNEIRAGVGIAAVQFGELKRMFYINLTADENSEPFRDLLINPTIVAEGAVAGALSGGEGCLSVPVDMENTDGLVHRKIKVVIKGYSYLSKKEVQYSKYGYTAIVIQHEFDHINGILFVDKINRKKKWEHKPDEVLI